MRSEVIDVAAWPVVSQETGGAVPKDWLSPPQYAATENREQWWLYKPVKRGIRKLAGGGQVTYRRYDDKVEHIASALARLIDLPAADIALATNGVDHGIISRNVAPNGWSMDGGDVFLSEFPGYLSCQQDPKPTDRIGHNLRNIETLLSGMTGPPGPCEMWRAFEVFAGYLCFDAWIGNTDRHAMNWGVLQRGGESKLAPSFDHGSALASGIPDQDLAQKTVENFASGGTAYRFEGGRKISLGQFARAAVDAASGRAKDWLDRIAAVQERHVAEVVAGVPGLSDQRRTFLEDVLQERRRRLS